MGYMLFLFFLTATLFAKETVILTEPRSGTHWLQASIQYLTKRPVHPFNPGRLRRNIRLHTFGLNILKIKIDRSKSPFYRAHTVKEIERFAKNATKYGEENLLIFLTRNYHHCIPRHIYSFYPEKNPNDVVKKELWFADDYIERFRLYEKWPEKNRLLIYYEELMKNPESTMEKVLTFMGEPDTHFQSYKETLPHLTKKSTTFYKNVVLKRKTRNLTPLSFRTSRWLTNYLQQKDRRIYDTYIQQYKEIN